MGNEHEKLTPKEQKGLIESIFSDFCDADDDSDLLSFIDHIGFDLRVISNARELYPAFVAYYRLKTGVYDVDRATNDLVTWPPIAARIAELASTSQQGLPNDL